MAESDRSLNVDHALRVLVIAQSPVTEMGLIAMLERAGYLALAGNEEGFSDSVSDIDITAPDVVVVDLLGPADDVQFDRFLDTPALFLVDSGPDRTVRDSSTGWLRRDAGPAEVIAAIEAVAAGLNVHDPTLRDTASIPEDVSSPLTDREVEVLSALADGLTNKAIAFDLRISEHTVKYHVGSILTKLDVSSRTEAVSVGVRLGLIAL